jgi:5,10-methylenetetrahydromethanopterin reductase
VRIGIAFDGSTTPLHALEIARVAEQVGLDVVLNAEHLGLHDAVVPSALQLAHTDRIDVGLVGLNADSRNPGLLAMELAGLCDIAPGRVAIQVGAGSPELARSIGIARQVGTVHIVERFVASLVAVLRGESVTESNDAFLLDRFRLRGERELPLVQLMAIGPRMLALSANIAEGVSVSAGLPLSGIAESVATVEAELDRLGRDRNAFRVSAIATLGYDADDIDVARRRAARVLAYAPIEPMRRFAAALELPDQSELTAVLRSQGAAAAGELFAPATVDTLALVADRATLHARLCAFAEVGVDELALMLTGSPERNIEFVRDLGAVRAALSTHRPLTQERHDNQ